MTILLWVLLGCAIVPLVVVVTYLVGIALLFGADSPRTTLAQYFFWPAMLLLINAGSTAVALFSLWLWGLPKWRILSFPIAIALDIAVLAEALRIVIRHRL
jgi:hypothetical protein